MDSALAPSIFSFTKEKQKKNEAVSYTHLDVYKRQSVFCMITRTFAIYGIDQVSNIFSYILVTIIVLVVYLMVAYPCLLYTSRCV